MAPLSRSLPLFVFALAACPPPAADTVSASEVDASSTSAGSGGLTGGGVTDSGAPTGTTASEPEVTSTGSTAALADTEGTGTTAVDTTGTSPADTTESTAADSTTTDIGASTTGSTSTGEIGTSTEGGTSSDGDTSSSTGADDTTGGEGAFECCEAGCKQALVQGHPGAAEVIVSGDRLVSHDPGKKTILWDRVTREPLRVEYGGSDAYLAGSLFAVRKNGTLRWYDATDGTLLAASNAGSEARGLATDGSYLWQTDAGGLHALALDGSELWFQPGVFQNGRVHAVPGLLLASSGGSGKLIAIDLNTDMVDEIPIQGDVMVWWSDGSGRFATLEGQAYRIYAPDGTQLAAGLGQVALGHGDLYMTGSIDVRSISQPNKILKSFPFPDMRSNNALLYIDLQQPRVVALEQDQIVETVLPPFQHEIARFGYAANNWALSGADGYIGEKAGDEYTLGQFAHLDASRSGRIVAASKFGITHVWDITDECGTSKTGAIKRLPRPMTIADGGEVLVAVSSGGKDTMGAEFRALPAGGLLGTILGGTDEMLLRASEDASLFARRYVWNGDESSVLTFPAGDKWFQSQGSFPTYVSPDGQHAALTEPWQVYWNQEKGYVYGEGGLVSVFDGLIYGFLDDERLIRGKHEKKGCNGYICFPFLGAEIITLDGAVVQATPLPEVPGFQRISATELLVVDPPRIYDAYTGALLWSLPQATVAAAVGEDFVVTSDGGELVVHKWR